MANPFSSVQAKSISFQKNEDYDHTLHAMEQKRLLRSCKYLSQASQVPPNFDLVEGFVSLD